MKPTIVSAGIWMISWLATAAAQTDPGVRPGPINGQPTATATSPLPLASVLTPGPNDPANALAFLALKLPGLVRPVPARGDSQDKRNALEVVLT